MEPIIHSLIDNDLYKFTMQHAVIKVFPHAKVRYQFINRAKTPFPDGFMDELKRQIAYMQDLKLTVEEKQYLAERCFYLDPTYLDFLMGFRYDASEIVMNQNNGALEIDIEGYWYRTILWEVPLMALISELYFRMTGQNCYPVEEIIEVIDQKRRFYEDLGVKVADFGTRRRYSHRNHDLVVENLYKYPKTFIGSSNVYLAKKYGVAAIGTHAHEWFMFHAAKYGYKMANSLALENWVNVYRGDLGIALSDTFTTAAFFEAFDKKFAKLFDGVRHDSGDPIEFAKMTIEHYQKLKIDPMSKSIVFSDALNPQKVETIIKYCIGKINASFGIGTNFTNDVGVKPLNMVIKITEAKPEGKMWIPTVKLSDEPGKHTGAATAIRLCKEVLLID